MLCNEMLNLLKKGLGEPKVLLQNISNEFSMYQSAPIPKGYGMLIFPQYAWHEPFAKLAACTNEMIDPNTKIVWNTICICICTIISLSLFLFFSLMNGNVNQQAHPSFFKTRKKKEEKTKNKEDKTFESFGTRREWVGTHTCNIGNSGRIKAREVRGISRWVWHMVRSSDLGFLSITLVKR